MLYCPKCGNPQYCGCDECKDKIPKGIKPYKWDNTGEMLSCGKCGFTKQAEWWITLLAESYLCAVKYNEEETDPHFDNQYR
jgi:hypothetical protein